MFVNRSESKADSTVLNSRIGGRVRAGSLKVARIGEGHNQTYKIQDLGSDLKILEELALDEHKFAEELKAAKYPMIIVGDGVYGRNDGHAILSLIHKIVDKYNISGMIGKALIYFIITHRWLGA